MIPSLVATELQGRIREFLRTTFPATTPGFLRPNGRTMLDDFLAQPGRARALVGEGLRRNGRDVHGVGILQG